MDQFLQILCPQQEGAVCLGPRRDAGRQLFLIPGVESGQNPADQRGGLAADVSVGEHQQLVEKIQGLLLLSRAPVSKILFKNGHIGPQPLPLLFTAGSFQNVGKQLFPAQAVHQTDIVIHRRVADGGDHLIGGHQRHILPGAGSASRGGKRGVHAEGDHILLKVLQLFIDVAVATLLGGIDIVQLAQNYVEGFLERVEVGDLLPALVPGLLDPEIGVHQHQRFGGEVLDLQVPNGVIGGDAA